MADTIGTVPAGTPAPVTPAQKPKFPGAKTYKDRQGNIREVGTGRLIRRAPAKKPKTFVDGQGVVRQVGTARGGRPAIAVNPLDRQIDASILTQTTPLTGQIGQANAQFAAEQEAINAANQSLVSSLQGIQDRLAALGQQQGQAAQAAGLGAASAQQGNLAYLNDLLGGSGAGVDLAGAAMPVAATAQSENAGRISTLGTDHLGYGSDISQASAASVLQSGRDIADRMLNRNAALKDLQTKIAAIKANRVGIKNDLINQSLDQQAARQQIRLAQAEFDRAGEQQAFQNDLAQQEIDAAAASGGSGSGGSGSGEGGDRVNFGGIRLPAGQAGLVRDGIGAWRAQPDAKRTLNSFVARVRQSSGLSGVMVARLAMNMLTPAELKRYSKSRAAFIKSMQQFGVNKATREAWANRVFGKPGSKPANTVTLPAGTVVGPNGQITDPNAVTADDLANGTVNIG